jgi:hypothetical protein
MRKMQIIRLILVAIFVNCHINATSHSGSMLLKIHKKREYLLFADMKTDYSIYVSIDASESEIWAARELQHWLMEISGAYFPIVEYSEELYGGWFRPDGGSSDLRGFM